MHSQGLKIAITARGLVIGTQLFDEAPPLPALIAAIGQSVIREHELCDGRRPWRKFVTFDDLGIYSLFDHSIDRVLDVHFSFAKARRMYEPTSLYSGILNLNGVRLTAGMRERSIPKTGEFRFAKQGGWVSDAEILFVHIRTAGPNKKLQDVAITFQKAED